eukprot:TRINITY_DN56101_c0_g2_i2.p1 TRINITY_DN56101_c0_g2~~TRINITY_DN56101_c0_g2_i2.p1  ORF type:complete len:828 (+),score=213.67 TRINITY_DN56101_c0_g2_i2:93-2576(+)
MRQMVRHVRQRQLRELAQDTEDEDLDLDEKELTQEILAATQRFWPPEDKWRLKDFARSESRQKSHSAVSAEVATLPEDICMLDSMRRGLLQLKSCGLDGLARKAPLHRLRKAVQELEALEAQYKRHVADPVADVARWILEQIERTPWSTSAEYLAVLGGPRQKRNQLFSVSGHGDPSGWRGLGISFLRMSGLDAVPEAAALSAVQRLSDEHLQLELQRFPAASEQEVTRRGSRQEKIAFLRQLQRAAAEEVEKHLLTGGSQRPNNVELRKRYEKMLQEAFEFQLAQLSALEDVEDFDNEAGTGHEAQGPEDQSVDAGFEDMLDDLEAALDGNDASPVEAADEQEDDAGAELARFRATLQGKTGPLGDDAPDDGQGAPETEARAKIPMLKVVRVEKTPLGKPIERVTYVFGEANIKLYQARKAGRRGIRIVQGRQGVAAAKELPQQTTPSLPPARSVARRETVGQAPSSVRQAAVPREMPAATRERAAAAAAAAVAAGTSAPAGAAQTASKSADAAASASARSQRLQLRRAAAVQPGGGQAVTTLLTAATSEASTPVKDASRASPASVPQFRRQTPAGAESEKAAGVQVKPPITVAGSPEALAVPGKAVQTIASPPSNAAATPVSAASRQAQLQPLNRSPDATAKVQRLSMSNLVPTQSGAVQSADAAQAMASPSSDAAAAHSGKQGQTTRQGAGLLRLRRGSTEATRGTPPSAVSMSAGSASAVSASAVSASAVSAGAVSVSVGSSSASGNGKERQQAVAKQPQDTSQPSGGPAMPAAATKAVASSADVGPRSTAEQAAEQEKQPPPEAKAPASKRRLLLRVDKKPG